MNYKIMWFFIFHWSWRGNTFGYTEVAIRPYELEQLKYKSLSLNFCIWGAVIHGVKAILFTHSVMFYAHYFIFRLTSVLTTLPQSNDVDLKKTIEQRLTRGSVFTGSGQIVTVDLGWATTINATSVSPSYFGAFWGQMLKIHWAMVCYQCSLYY